MAKKTAATYGYSGRIGNAGAQKVVAPFAATKTAKGTVCKVKDAEA